MSSPPLKMQFQNLGQSGLKVSRVILGAVYDGDPKWQDQIMPEEGALPLLEHAYKVGIRTWETADMYSHGRSEEIIAKAIEQYELPRESLVIMTKLFFGVTPEDVSAPSAARSVDDGDMINQVGLSRKHIIDTVDKSVARLGTYIDVLQIQCFDHSTPREETMRALNDVVESGKVRYIGASCMAAWEFQTLQNIADKNGWHKFISMRNHYSLIYREDEHEMIPYCHDTGVGLISWSALALDRLWNERSTRRDEKDKPVKNLAQSREDHDRVEIVSRVEQIAQKLGISMAQVALAWCFSKKDMYPVIGVGSIADINEACEACNLKLNEEDIRLLEEAYFPRRRADWKNIL